MASVYANDLPVHSAMLSVQLFCGLPHPRLPSSVHCSITLVRPSGIGPLSLLHVLAGIPVEGKSSECLICMKFRIIILIIIISRGQIFYRILQTHHACTHARGHTRMRAYTNARARHAYTHEHAGIQAHTHARTREHTCTHTAVSAITVRRTVYRYSSAPSRDRQLRWHS